MFDVAIIGAGLAGLTCAQQLHQAGYRVVVIEKSRGVGGRVATRRLHNTLADHGVRYVESQGALSQQMIQRLVQRGILDVWTQTIYELKPAESEPVAVDSESSQFPRYVAPTGMTAIAKFLATGLDIWLNRRVQSITPTPESTWHLTIDSASEPPKELTAKAVIVAIPAPQSWMLLEPLAPTTLSPAFLEHLRSVEFDPCISVMAGYSAEVIDQAIWKSCTLSNDSDLAWIGLDSSKRPNSKMPVFVLQSTAEFANRYLEAQDLNLVGQELLSRAAQLLIPGLDTPDWLQVHRWRYAFPKSPLNQDCLNAELSMPLVCCGDWCGGNRIESAMNSGLAAAVQINHQMQKRSLPETDFFAVL